MADSKRTQSKAPKPGELNEADANVLDPQQPEGRRDEGREDLAREVKRVHGDRDLDALRDKRNEAAAAGDAAATAHLDNLIREAEAAEAEKHRD